MTAAALPLPFLRGKQRINSLNYLEPCHEAARATFHSPFLDPDMIATSLTVPGWLKAGWRRQKRVLREAVADLLPPVIRNRPKAIQRLDTQGRLGLVLAEMAAGLLSGSSIESHRLLTRKYLRKLCLGGWRASVSRERAHRLWTVLSLEYWVREFLDQRGAEQSWSDVPAGGPRGGNQIPSPVSR